MLRRSHLIWKISVSPAKVKPGFAGNIPEFQWIRRICSSNAIPGFKSTSRAFNFFTPAATFLPFFLKLYISIFQRSSMLFSSQFMGKFFFGWGGREAEETRNPFSYANISIRANVSNTKFPPGSNLGGRGGKGIFLFRRGRGKASLDKSRDIYPSERRISRIAHSLPAGR